MKHVGIFAGTFDPIHQGHIGFCQAAMEQCDLDRVFLLPERKPREKHAATDFGHRVALLELALTQHPDLDLLILDEDQFTVERTLPSIQAALPDVQLTFLLGSDVACGSLAQWQHLDTLLSQATLAIAVRNTDSSESVRQAMYELGRIHASLQYNLIQTAHEHLSSSQIRKSGTGLDTELLQYSRLNNLYNLS